VLLASQERVERHQQCLLFAPWEFADLLQATYESAIVKYAVRLQILETEDLVGRYLKRSSDICD
jgi:hypothetical protein